VRNLVSSILSVFLFFALVSFTNADPNTSPAKGSPVFVTTLATPPSLHDILYADLSMEEKGLSKEAFDYAMKGYEKLVDEEKISNTTYLTICDMSQSSKRKRLYVVDMEKKEVVINTWVSHGKNSGLEYASKFSNREESFQTSLGFYITQFTYNGENGYSLKLKGLEAGFNDKAFERAIVIHGADYIGSERIHSGYMGRSYGCPAVPAEESEALINTIKNGTCLFIYHPDKKYTRGSKILND
jgi:hypothetical protein